MRKETVALYTELLSRHLPGRSEEHQKSKVLAFTWRDLGAPEI